MSVPVETWESPERGRIAFRTLVGGREVVPSGLTAGVIEIQPGDGLRRHSHSPAEVYYVLQGRCLVRVGEEEHELAASGCVLIPGGEEHAVSSVGEELVRVFYVLAAESMAKVDFFFCAE